MTNHYSSFFATVLATVAVLGLACATAVAQTQTPAPPAPPERIQPGTPASAIPAASSLVAKPSTRLWTAPVRGFRWTAGFLARHPKISFAVAAGATTAAIAVVAGRGGQAAPYPTGPRGVCSDPNPRVCGIPLPTGRGR